MESISPPPLKEALQLYGRYDEETKRQWSSLMGALNEAGLIEMTPDVMQADLVVRSYQRFTQLDEVAHETIATLLGKQQNAVSKFQEEQQRLLNDFLTQRVINGTDYKECMRALTEACNARLANLHNLLSVVSKAQFQHGQFFNKGAHFGALTRMARKTFGKTNQHDMERLADGLKAEVDELNLAVRGGTISIDLPADKILDAEFTELQQMETQMRLDEIRKPLASKDE